MLTPAREGQSAMADISWRDWHTYLGVVGLLTLILALIVAPYHLWKREKIRADTLEAATKPTVRPTKDIRMENDTNYQSGASWGISNLNDSDSDAFECIGVIEAGRWVKAKPGKTVLPFLQRELHWPVHGKSRTIGPRQKARMSIITGWEDVIGKSSYIEMAYAVMDKNQRERTAIKIDDTVGDFLLMVRLASTGTTPYYFVVKVSPQTIKIALALKSDDISVQGVHPPIELVAEGASQPDLASIAATL